MLAMNDPLSVSVTSFMGSRRSVRPGGKMIRDFLMAMVASFMRFPSLSRRLRYFFSSRVFGLAASMLLPAVVCAGPIVPDPVFSGYITWGTPTQITFINGPGFFDSGTDDASAVARAGDATAGPGSHRAGVRFRQRVRLQVPLPLLTLAPHPQVRPECGGDGMTCPDKSPRSASILARLPSEFQ